MFLSRNFAAFLIALVVALVGCRRQANVENTNQLLLGQTAKTHVAQSISLKRPIDLTGMSIEQIVGVRKQLVDAYKDLFQEPYTSWSPLFSRIKSDSPWVSTMGLQYDGLENLCGNGESYESLTILNPFLLVSPHFTGLSRIAKNFEWDPAKVTRDKASAQTFPLYIKPSSMEWKAKEAYARVSFELSDFLNNINPFLKTPLSERNAAFHLIAYNALDFNFRFMAFSTSETSNIAFENPLAAPIAIRDILMARQIIADGPVCNAASYPRKEVYGVSVKALPAQLSVLLWKSQPKDINAVPDMTFVIAFR